MTITTDQLFAEARTQNGYLPAPVTDETLRQLYDMLKWGPTSANCSPTTKTTPPPPGAATTTTMMASSMLLKIRMGMGCMLRGMFRI